MNEHNGQQPARTPAIVIFNDMVIQQMMPISIEFLEGSIRTMVKFLEAKKREMIIQPPQIPPNIPPEIVATESNE